jgi:peptide/nickel transport system ATP-binding protein
MYAGRVVECGDTADVLNRPAHPYTAGLIGSIPSRNRRGEKLRQIPGMTPSLMNLPAGCTFLSRCDRATLACADSPALREQRAGQWARCIHPLPGTPL